MSYGYTHKQWVALHLVRQMNSIDIKVTAYSVARSMGVSHVSARKYIRMLEQSGLVYSEIDSCDERENPRKLSYISEKGLEVCNQTMHVFIEWQNRRLEGLLS